MNKKGIQKFWIEIIGGVVIVVIILVILIATASVVGTSVVDAKNSNEMVALYNGFATALAEPGLSEHTVSPFEFQEPTSGSQIYAMVYITPRMAEKIVDGKSIDVEAEDIKGFGDQIDRLSDRVELQKISKCIENEDACICLFRFKYDIEGGHYCHSGIDNIILTDPGYGGSKKAAAADSTLLSDEEYLWKDEFLSIEEMFGVTFIENRGFINTKIIECKLLVSELGCATSFPGGDVLPCIPHYQDKPLVWLSTKKDKGIDAEFVHIDVKSYNADPVCDKDKGTTCITGTSPSLISVYPNVELFDLKPSKFVTLNFGEAPSQINICNKEYCGACRY